MAVEKIYTTWANGLFGTTVGDVDWQTLRGDRKFALHMPVTANQKINELKIYLKRTTNLSTYVFNGDILVEVYATTSAPSSDEDYQLSVPTGNALATGVITNAQLNALPLNNYAGESALPNGLTDYSAYFQRVTVGLSSTLSLPAGNYKIVLKRRNAEDITNEAVYIPGNAYSPSSRIKGSYIYFPSANAWQEVKKYYSQSTTTYNWLGQPQVSWYQNPIPDYTSGVYELNYKTTELSFTVSANGDAKGVATSAENPKIVPHLINGNPLPVNSVVRNSDGKKFLKTTGNEFSFAEIETTPPVKWKMGSFGSAAWAVLQEI